MNRPLRLLAASLALGAVVVGTAHAAEIRPVTCSVTIDYLRNDLLRSSYKRDFVVMPGETYFDDFSTAVRFGDFTATTRLEGNDTVVDVRYYNEVTVLDTVQLNTKVQLLNGNPNASTGEHIFTSPIPTSTGAFQYIEHTTRYSLSCQRLKL
jgi:hypothetical protein